MKQRIIKICKHHGELAEKDIGFRISHGYATTRCLVCSREYDKKKHAEGYVRPYRLNKNHVRKKRIPAFNKEEIVKYILSRIDTDNVEMKKALIKIANAIAQTYDPKFNNY